jgi:malignant T-cell-amplified sequence
MSWLKFAEHLTLKLCLQADKGEAVAIYAENKENALAIGALKMSTAEIREVNKGHGVENLHFLTDGLWNQTKLGV